MRALVLAVLLLGCKSRPAFHDAPAKPAAGALLGTYALTYYWVSTEADESAAGHRLVGGDAVGDGDDRVVVAPHDQ